MGKICTSIVLLPILLWWFVTKIHGHLCIILQLVLLWCIITKIIGENIHFEYLDVSNVSKIKEYVEKKNQLILMKDVLMQWTNEEVVAWMDKLTQLLTTEHFIIANNWKYYRKPEKNNQERALDKRYSLAPIDSQKPPLNKYGFEIIFHYRFKQVSLLKGTPKCSSIPTPWKYTSRLEAGRLTK